MTVSIAPCLTSGNDFFVKGDIPNVQNKGLGIGDKIKINSTIYKVTGMGYANCAVNPISDPAIDTVMVTVDKMSTGIGNGMTAYPANPDDVIIQIDGPISIGDGYQTFIIETYELLNSVPVSTNYHVERSGDGILGTSEDIIEVIAGNSPSPFVIDESGTSWPITTEIFFPTGVSNAYFANSGGGKVVKYSNGTEVNLDSIDPSSFNDFDYISDFALDSLEFKKYTVNGNLGGGDKILELTIDAKVDDTTTQTYKINATLNQ